LNREWREWITGKEEPKNPDAGFIASFVAKSITKEGLERNGS
jgi:hypothetical protein